MTEQVSFHDLCAFTKEILQRKNIKDFQIVRCSGDEGLVLFEEKKILLGERASKRLAVHEVAHILVGEQYHHYTAVFEDAYRDLCREFLTE